MAATKIVLAGGPGAGKTAILELAREHFVAKVEVLPEAASMTEAQETLSVLESEGLRPSRRLNV